MSEINDQARLEDKLPEELTLEQALQLAMRLHQANQFEAAEEVYQKLLEIAPENPVILHFFGLLRHQRGYSDEGIALIKASLESVPDYIDARNNLGNIYLQMGDAELAEASFRLVLELNPNFVSAYGNLGVALKDLKRYPEAIEYLLKAVDLEPNVAYHYQNLGNAYRNMRQYREAADMYRKSIKLAPFNSESYRKLYRTFYIMGEKEQCLDVFNQWLAHDPENPTAIHMHAAFSGGEIPDRASDDYVRQTFDRFAASFDVVLKELEYKAPFLVRDAVQDINPNSNNWHILDIGCGTGLSGALLRPLAEHLDGVDLSPKMLECAEARGVYDALYEAELTAFLLETEPKYEAITCVDTFCYFGDLTDAVNASVHALKPNGWFIFTLEMHESDDSNQDFHLNLHGRYSHSETYVRKTLTNAGYEVNRIDKAILRKECGEEVVGLVVNAQLD